MLETKFAEALAAIREYRTLDVGRLIRAYPDLTGASDQNGNTLLHHAARHGLGDAIRRLVREGADPQRRNFFGLPPAFETILTKSQNGLVAMLDAGARPDDVCDHGDTLAEWAQMAGLNVENFFDLYCRRDAMLDRQAV